MVKGKGYTNGERVGFGQKINWKAPYHINLKDLIRQGRNTLLVEVTSILFNRLVFDAGQSEEKLKTWTINEPVKDVLLRVLRLMGSVVILERRIGGLFSLDDYLV